MQVFGELVTREDVRTVVGGYWFEFDCPGLVGWSLREVVIFQLLLAGF